MINFENFEFENMVRNFFGDEFLKSAEDTYNRFCEKFAGLYKDNECKDKKPCNGEHHCEENENKCKCGNKKGQEIETVNGRTIRLALPGVKKENVSIKAEGKSIKISVVNLKREEYSFVSGGLHGVYYLGDGYAVENAKAKMEDGVLTVFVPKVEKEDKKFEINID